MPRSKRVFKKRKCVGKPAVKDTDTGAEVNETVVTESAKLDNSFLQYKEFDENREFGYEFISLNALQNVFDAFAACKNCNGGLSLEIKRRIGLASELQVCCKNCKSCSTFFNCEKLENAESKVNLYDLNMRFVYALRSIGKGQAAGRMLCGVMNLPPPPAKFSHYNKVLTAASEQVCTEQMKVAAEECISVNDNNRDLCVAFDGTWQKRGHLSHNGVVTATSVDTGKVIDVQVMSKFCKCPSRNHSIHLDTCTANYSGTSGGMEVSGVKEIFNRSQTLYDARYVKYLGDGDSKAFKTVMSSKVYGDQDIEKLECIGHIQKRMGSRLTELKKKYSGKKLSDGKSLGGKNRLTDIIIMKIQKFYGLAIRRNVGSLQNMQQAVWAEYFHLLSNNENPNHGLCPVGSESWCGFHRAQATGKTYDHTKHTHVPLPIMEVIKPVFRDLANPELLRKCLHGKTQNPNESVNSVIWTRVPKNVFVTIETLKFGVFDAVSCFNAGNVTKCLTLSKIGINPGHHCVKTMKNLDNERVIDRERKLSEYHKKAKIRNKFQKRKLEESYEIEEGDDPSYKRGFH